MQDSTNGNDFAQFTIPLLVHHLHNSVVLPMPCSLCWPVRQHIIYHFICSLSLGERIGYHPCILSDQKPKLVPNNPVRALCVINPVVSSRSPQGPTGRARKRIHLRKKQVKLATATAGSKLPRLREAKLPRNRDFEGTSKWFSDLQ